MKKQYGIRHLAKMAVKDFPNAAESLMKSPKLIYDVLNDINSQQQHQRYTKQSQPLKKQKHSHKRGFILGAGVAFLASAIVGFSVVNTPGTWQWVGTGLGILLIITGWAIPKAKR